MCPDQLEVAVFGVIEIGYRPTGWRMTAVALRTERAIVRVFLGVTACTVLRGIVKTSR